MRLNKSYSYSYSGLLFGPPVYETVL